MINKSAAIKKCCRARLGKGRISIPRLYLAGLVDMANYIETGKLPENSTFDEKDLKKMGYIK